MSKRQTILGIGFAILAAAGWADWTIRDRRGASPELQRAVQQVESLPQTIGQWQGTATDFDSIVLRVSRCAAYKSQRFVHNQTGRSVDVTIMVGLPGPMAEHLPEVCYPAGGYQEIGGAFQRRAIAEWLNQKSAADELVHIDFVKPPEFNTPTRVWHGWYDGAHWSRPQHPRLSFFRLPRLFRLHVSAALLSDPFDEHGQSIDPGEEFLRDALPILTKALTEGGDS